MFKKFELYFIGDALLRSESPFSKMRVEFIYRFSLFSMFTSSIFLYDLWIGHYYYVCFIQLSFLSSSGLMLLLIRKTKSYKASGFVWLLTCVLTTLFVMIMLGGNLSIIVSLWFMFNIVSIFIIMGTMWGGITAAYYFAIIFFSLLVHKGIVPNVEIGVDFSRDRNLSLNMGFMEVLTPILLLFYILYSFISAQKRTQEIMNEQIKLVRKQKNEITDSIQYAKRIQSAILPPLNLLDSQLKDHFVLYQPKDIIAGDFYWLSHTKGKILFAVADCTGHGVPGALVSVVCNNALNRSVREYELTKPGEILDKAREIVVQEFSKSDEDVKDGMDIALCSIEGQKLEYAGAYNPLWIIRNGEIIETKANRQPVGKQINPKPFTTFTIDLEKNDLIYLFSDGFVDQFGGEHGKKFKAKAFRELLLNIQNESIIKQKELIHDTFKNWKGDLDQIDDICILALRI